VPDAPCFVQGGSMTELATDCDVFKDLENLEYKEMDAEWRTNFCESAYSGLPIVSESPEGLACSNSREVKVWQSGNNFSASCRPYMCQCDGDTPDPDLPPDDRGECSYEFEYTLQLPTQEMNYGGPNLKAYTCDDAAFDNNITAVSSSPNGQVCSSEGSRLAHSCNVYKCVCPTNSGSGNNENGNTNTGTPGGGGTPCPDMNEQSGTGNTREQYEDSEWIDRCAGKTGGGLG